VSIAEKFETIADRVYEKGKSDEHYNFWHNFQNQGYSGGYTYAFYGGNWTDKIYNPLYDIKVSSNCNGIFANSRITNTKVVIDLTADTLKSNTASMFEGAKKLVEIPLLKLKDDGSNNLNRNFDGCEALTTINFEGKIGRDVSFADCPLSVKSLKNIIEHLMDYSGNESGRGKYTLTFSDDCWKSLEASGAAPDGDTWENYVIKLGWLVG
jgi:hypothetical protein